MGPRDRVAYILTLCVLIFYIAGTLSGLILRLSFPDKEIFHDVEIAGIWSDITKTLIGGLLVYIAGKYNDEAE